jgi:endoglucanase
MRPTFVPTITTVFALLGLYACASGKATNEYMPAYGGATSSAPSNGGVTTMGQGGATTVGQGGATTTTAVTGSGGATPISSAKGGAPATGGAATGGATGCTDPAQPVASWKSFAACKATPTAMETMYTTWRSAYFVDCSSQGQAYVRATTTDFGVKSVSEGTGYGMLAAALMNKADDFKKLAAYYVARMKNGSGLMPWRYPDACTGGAEDQNVAPDGDADAAMALIVAAKTFNTPSYLDSAKKAIAALKTVFTDCGGRSLMKPSDGWGGCDDLNPSYFATGYYRIFGTVTNDATFWNKAATDGLAMLAQWQTATGNGTVPDWGKSSGALGGTSSRASLTKYGSEACRVPWRIAVDYGWSQNAAAKTFLSAMYDGILKQSRPYFAIDPNSQNSSPYVGGFAQVGTAMDQATADLYFSDWYVQRAYVADNTYYAITLKLLYLITMGGRFDNGQ